MDAEAKAMYDAHVKNRRISYDVLKTAKMEGRAEGRAEGFEEGRLLVIVNAYKQGLPVPTIALIAATREEEVLRILREQGFGEL